MNDNVWELSCWSSCLRWVDWLLTSRMVVISRWQGRSRGSCQKSTLAVMRCDGGEESSILSAMKVLRPERDPTIRGVVIIEDTTNP